MILCLETATTTCSVALCNSDGIIAIRESNDIKSHASLLTVFIEEILKEVSISSRELKAVAVSKGPGSYTGLRIGVSVAKGICYSASLPLIGIDTTLSMYYGIRYNTKGFSENVSDLLFCPMIDARRMEIYHAIYNSEGIPVKTISAEIIDENSFSDIPETKRIVIFGDGAAKCIDVIKRPNIIFCDWYRISAGSLCLPSFIAYNANQFENVAYFEPFYLKDFITSKPRKNIF
jgi:tRNA threonylcarbamoyladenosine biosynthesis protein TsaB